MSDGAPRLFIGNCHPAAGPGEDVCFISRDLDGELFVLVLRDPGPLSSGDTLEPGVPVGVLVRLGERAPLGATGGEVVLDEVAAEEHYAGRVRLEFPSGRLTGTFDVLARP